MVYTKACLHYTDTVVKYLARYTYRIAITNARSVNVDSKQVTFRVKDYRNNSRHKTVSLAGATFVQRFLLHVLPKGLMRIRRLPGKPLPSQETGPHPASLGGDTTDIG